MISNNQTILQFAVIGLLAIEILEIYTPKYGKLSMNR